MNLMNETAGYTLSLKQTGFGNPNSNSMIAPGTEHSLTILYLIIISNTPQILLSMAYFFYNRNLTKMILASEYDNLATSYKPLRVSCPAGAQRSTYYLTLPYRYIIP